MIDLLDSGAYSLVVRSAKGEVRYFTSRGVDDLYFLMKNEPEFLRGASLADKIIGKGAAAIMIAMSVKSVETHVVSEGALAIFAQSDVELSYGETTPYIINRDKTGSCPLELSLKEENKIEKIIEIIEKRKNYADK